MKHIVLGTAGHVDHGKTTLVKYLSGVDTDRLKEEKDRGITIELGFAPFTLPDGQRVGVVDVPGHERFIKNMLAGATGIDLVLFVIAADEGVMPQTKEHMDILRLLGVTRGVVAVTKIDKVEEEWLELVLDDLRDFIAASPLEGAPIIGVSSVTGEGVPRLLEEIARLCRELPERSSAGHYRQAVDRVFSMSGFGTVVTGTVWGGSVKVGDSVEVFPSGKTARVRSLQVHGEARDAAYAGERAAVNLTGVDRIYVERGGWLAAPGILKESHRIDMYLQALPGAPEITQRMRVHVHHGTGESLGKVVLLGRESLAPGESCFAQLELEEPLAALPGDRLVIRFYSPMFTIAGGSVLIAPAVKHKQKFLPDELRRLEALQSGEPDRMLVAMMEREARLWTRRQLIDLTAGFAGGGERLLDGMIGDGRLTVLPDGLICLSAALAGLRDGVAQWIDDYHRRYPMRFGASRKELGQARLDKLSAREQKSLLQYIESLGEFEMNELIVWRRGWEPVLTDRQRQAAETVLARFTDGGFSPPAWSAAAGGLAFSESEKDELLLWLLRSGALVRISDDAYYSRELVGRAEKMLRGSGESFSIASARDLLGTTRKYAQQLCEYFDNIGLSYFDGENHIWKKRDD